MHMFRLLLNLLTVGAKATNCPVGGQPGIDSTKGVQLCFQDPDTDKRHLRLVSPNPEISYVVDGYHGQFYVRGRPVGEQFLVGGAEEFIRSPDGRAAIITSWFGGAGPGYAEIDYANEHSRQTPNIAKPIKKRFESSHRRLECADNPNVVGLGWSADSRTAFLMAQTPEITDCGRTWGYFDVYAVSIPAGKTLAAYPMAEALVRFRQLLGPGVRRDVPRLPNAVLVQNDW